ncbi:hypothetical protein U7118_07520 [Bacillus subtilis]|uniref:hypothetical protein n=1 Tax=Bacillus subtilis TaxID=1423 RepID=UPI002B4BB172|nr:hypothetical protein [Bacillus subtilis]MEC0399900.1 hypothetical protein [Bacillus subtilis]WRK89077.1 hypothetical protein U7118_07520 [Bacillus subtilis]
MKKHEKLIQLINAYQITRRDEDFNLLFEESRDLISKVISDFSKTRQVIREDILSALHEKLWKWSSSVDTKKIKNAENAIIYELKKSSIDIIRGKNGTYVKRHKLMDSTAEENAATFESGAVIHIEDKVISQLDGEIKTDQDKLQLIKALTVNSDAITTAIVNEHLSSERPTYASIGSKVGVHYKKVERVIKGLAKNYDASQHGELNAFLAV